MYGAVRKRVEVDEIAMGAKGLMGVTSSAIQGCSLGVSDLEIACQWYPFVSESMEDLERDISYKLSITSLQLKLNPALPIQTKIQ